MPRRLRLYAPNGIFHVTARTQECQHWFDEPLRDFICEVIETTLRRTDAKLRAGVIMSNHLHLVVQQGDLPLCHLMQPVLCRIALAVRRKYKIAGHVFGGRFWAGLCRDPAYLNTLVDYVHHNPVRAELCTSPSDWCWSSFGAYHGAVVDRLPSVEPFDSVCLDIPNACPTEPEPEWRRRPSLDLRDLLHVTLRRLTSGEIDLQALMDMRGRTASELRHELMRVAADAGYRGVHIARTLRVSESAVSRVVVSCKIRRARGIAESVAG